MVGRGECHPPEREGPDAFDRRESGPVRKLLQLFNYREIAVTIEITGHNIVSAIVVEQNWTLKGAIPITQEKIQADGRAVTEHHIGNTITIEIADGEWRRGDRGGDGDRRPEYAIAVSQEHLRGGPTAYV